MSDEMTVGEVARLFASLTVTVDRIENKLDTLSTHYVPREVYELEREAATKHMAYLTAKVEDTFSKKGIAGIISALALIAAAVGTLISVFH